MATKTAEREAYTPRELAKMYGMKRETIIALINAGEVRALDLGLKSQARYKIRRDDWEAFLKTREVGSPDQAEPTRQANKRSLPGVEEWV